MMLSGQGDDPTFGETEDEASTNSTPTTVVVADDALFQEHRVPPVEWLDDDGLGTVSAFEYALGQPAHDNLVAYLRCQGGP